jgi:hypothetical protein
MAAPPSGARLTPNLIACAVTKVSRVKSVAPQVEIKSMALRGRVGRHAQAGGRHCQNWADDQQTVIGLINRISVADGGAAGGLGGRVVAGIAGDALYNAIRRFEDKHFPGQRSGFLDPGGRMLKRMEDLAGRSIAPPPAAPPVPDEPPVPVLYPLEALRRNVLDDSPYVLWPAGERAAIAPLITMAVKHIDNLLAGGLFRLKWSTELFGRAYIRPVNSAVVPRANKNGTVSFYDLRTGNSEEPELPEMSYGRPVASGGDITTGKLGALLLFDGGYSCRVRAYHTGNIPYLVATHGTYGARPMPIAGALENFGIADIDPATRKAS